MILYKAEHIAYKKYRLEVDEGFIDMLREHQLVMLDKMVESAKHVKEVTPLSVFMSEYMKNYQKLNAVLRDGIEKDKKEHPAETEWPF